MFSSLTLAIVLVNPMMPAQPETQVTAQPTPQQTPSRRLQLEDVYVLGETRRAKINNQWLEASDQIAGWTISEIQLDCVFLTNRQQTRTLRLTQQRSNFSISEAQE